MVQTSNLLFPGPGKSKMVQTSNLLFAVCFFPAREKQIGSLNHFAFSGGEKQNESESNWKKQLVSGLQTKIKELWPNG